MRSLSSPRSTAGVPFDSVGILRTTSYCAPLRVPAVIGVLAVSRHDKPKTKTKLRECRSIRSGVSGILYDRTPPVCVYDIIGVLAVWLLNKNKNKMRVPPAAGVSLAGSCSETVID